MVTESVSLKLPPVPVLPLSSVRMVILPPKAVPATVALLFKLAVGLKIKPFNAALILATVPVIRIVSSSVPSLTAVEGEPLIVVLKVKPAVWLKVSVPFCAHIVTVISPGAASTSLIWMALPLAIEKVSGVSSGVV